MRKNSNITLKDIADVVGVSRVHVARAIYSRGYVEEKLRKKILKKAEELNYVPNRLATALVRGRTMNILLGINKGFYYYDIMSPMPNMIKSISDELEKYGYWLQVSADLTERKDIRADGIIILNGSEKKFRNFPDELFLNPMVTSFKLGANKIEAVEKNSIPYVAYDAFPGLLRLAELSARKAIKKVCVMNLASVNNPFPVKMSEIGTAFQRYGINIDKNDIINISRETEKITSRILETIPHLRKYDMCILSSEILASHFYQAADIAKLKIPEDLSIAGYDNAYYTQNFNPPLSSLYFSIEELAQKLVSLLISSINGDKGERHHIINTDFTDRGSIRS